jgi:hypothetical protein
MQLLMEDYVVLSKISDDDRKARSFHSPKTLKKEHPKTYERLIKSEYMAENGGLRQEALDAIDQIKNLEATLIKGVPFNKRKTPDPTAILKENLDWDSKIVNKQPITSNPFFAYLGKPHRSMNRKNKFSPTAKQLIQCVDPPKSQSSELIPYAYQITALDGIKIVWLRDPNGVPVAIQSYYFDFLNENLEGIKFYIYHNDTRIFAHRHGKMQAMIMPFDTSQTHMVVPKV